MSVKRRWLALGALMVLAAALVDIAIVPPRVTVRGRDDLSAVERVALEKRYRLESGRLDEGTTWRYELLDRSRENVRAVVNDPAVSDTGYIDRLNVEAPERESQVGFERQSYQRAATAPWPAGREPFRPSGWRVGAGPLGQLVHMRVSRSEISDVVARLAQRPDERLPLVRATNWWVRDDIYTQVVAESPSQRAAARVIRNSANARSSGVSISTPRSGGST